MANVAKYLFMPVGLGGYGIDFTKSRPFEDRPFVKHKDKSTPVADPNAAQNKAAQVAANANKKRAIQETDTTMSSALSSTDDDNSTTIKKKTLLGG